MHENERTPSPRTLQLQAPLLDDSTDQKMAPRVNVKWPEEAAKRTKLFHPSSNVRANQRTEVAYDQDDIREDDPYFDENEPRAFVLNYDAKHNKILVTSATTNEVVDNINPDDVIGADLEVKFFQSDLISQLSSALPKTKLDGNAESRKVGIFNRKSNQRMEEYAEAEETIQKECMEDIDKELMGPNNAKGSRKDNMRGASDYNDADNDDNYATITETVSGLLECVPGCSTNEALDNHAEAFLNIYSYPRARTSSGIWERLCECLGPNSNDDDHELDLSRLGHRHPRHRRFQVAPCEDFADARSVVRAIRRLAKLGQFEEVKQRVVAAPLPLKRYLVVINPFSGTKKSIEIYDKTVKVMLEQSGVEHDLFLTKYAGHASERMTENYSKTKLGNVREVEDGEKRDVSEYDAVIILSGDGLLFEALQGLKTRGDYEVLMERLKFGIVGCGTSNGLAASLLHAGKEKYGVVESTFKICKGQTLKMDLSTYTTENKVFTSFLTYSWGIIADIDIESERLRYLGSLRMDVWAVWRVLNLRHYKAKFSYLPVSKVKDLRNGGGYEQNCSNLNERLPESWESMDADFILFWVSHVTHAGYNVYQSPDSKMQDGIFRIMIVRKPCSRFTLARILLGLETGAHTSFNEVEFYDCVAFRLEPITDGSFNNLDGEVIESGPIQGRVLPSSCNIFI